VSQRLNIGKGRSPAALCDQTNGRCTLEAQERDIERVLIQHIFRSARASARMYFRLRGESRRMPGNAALRSRPTWSRMPAPQPCCCCLSGMSPPICQCRKTSAPFALASARCRARYLKLFQAHRARKGRWSVERFANNGFIVLQYKLLKPHNWGGNDHNGNNPDSYCAGARGPG
jgi:hypothetical protein